MPLETSAVSLDTGLKLVGETDGNIRIFKGIPYAEPPIGSLRWCPPVPFKGAGRRTATAFAPDPVQTPINVGFQGTRAPGCSEDCLYLNIWAPEGAENLPVMVWVFGGGFVGGSATNISYDGHALAQEGVVLVTISYRVGLLGFLSHPELSRESPHGVSGNYGLLDQMEALRWVRTNIAAFGGAPDNITLFGESAGGASTSYLMTSPLADDLFDKAILQSTGAMRGLMPLAEAEQRGGELGTLKALRSLPAEAILGMTGQITSGFRSVTAPRQLGPIMDGWLLSQNDWDAYASGAVRPRPLMLGCNGDEGELAARHRPFRTAEIYLKYLKTNFGEATKAAQAHYGVGTASGVYQALSDLFSDTQFLFGTRRVARAMSRIEPRTFLYWFDAKRAGQAASPTHGDELPYVFGTLDHPFDGDRTPFNAQDANLSKAMMRAWASFARTGQPNFPGLEWSAVTRDEDHCLHLAHEPFMGTFPRRASLDFLEHQRALPAPAEA